MTTTIPFTEADAKAWRESYPTPFYVYDEQMIRDTVRGVQEAFAWNPGFREYFAVKTLPTPAILRLLAELNCGADCASEAEIEMAARCGMRGERVILTSNQTQAADYQAAANVGAIINLDDLTQIANMQRAIGVPNTVCVRYNPGEFQFSNDIIGDLKESKFGVTREQLFAALEQLRELGVSRFGVHAMVASNERATEYYPALARDLFELVIEIRDRLDITVEFLDFGGGIGIPYLPEEAPADIAAIGAGVRKAYEEVLGARGLDVAIYTELGRYVTGPAGFLVTSVVGHKSTYKQYVGVDANAASILRPAMYGSYHHITAIGSPEGAPTRRVDVVGSLCENNDKLAVDRELPEVSEGDILVLHDAGAHARSMAYNYNGRLRPAELLRRTDGTVQMIRRAETLADYFATFDVDPEFQSSRL